MIRFLIPFLSTLAVLVTTVQAQVEGDPKRGAAQYRACIACHSLEPGTHLTGPSLAELWGQPAGEAAGFIRYSEGLGTADFTWDKATLDAWLADPQSMIPDTYMIFRGIADDQARADLIAFLEIAMAPGGAKAVLDRGLVPAEYVRGQKPDSLKTPPPRAQVTKIRHCRDSYFVTTADGTETPYWEMNLRLKLDTRETGPEPGKPVIVASGMMGDRASVVFARLDELMRFIAEEC
ncbi:c-type cytochrome [Fodinicurvata halophila]|uniref:C-type cytochrome n=1 Tax=Fodinicurvata halophila TaxID=1419723 RepID=A0ABV8UJA2_9PROT